MFDDNDMNIERLTPAQRELQEALRGLRPARPAIDRDRLMFEAGAATARRSINVWRAAAAVLVLGNVAAMTIALRTGDSDRTNQVVNAQPSQAAPFPQPPERAPVARASWDIPLPPPGRPLMPSADAGYLPVRDAVLRWGVSALPAQASGRRASTRSPDVREMLDVAEPQTPASPWAPLTAPIQRLFSGEQL